MTGHSTSTLCGLLTPDNELMNLGPALVLAVCFPAAG